MVGRAVANTEFMKALIRWGSFERFTFFVGEARDAAPIEAHFVATGLIPADRLVLANLLTLPEAIAAGGLDVFHLGEFSSAFADLVWLRDRHARGHPPGLTNAGGAASADAAHCAA